MKISLSVAAQDRSFSKMMRRIRPSFEPFFQAFSEVKLVDPIHEAILIGLTDAKPREYFEVVPNRDGFFQVLVGAESGLPEEEVRAMLVSAIDRVVRACPFSRPDKERFNELVSSWRQVLLEK